MAVPAHSNLGRRTLIAVVAALALMASTMPTAGASPRRGGPRRSAAPAFVLERGRFTSFEAKDPNVFLVPFGINNREQITGEYIRLDSESGLYRDPRGRVTSFDVPGAQGTEATDINESGQIVGNYSEDTPIVNDATMNVHGFLRERSGKFTTIDAPGAVLTTAVGVNNRRQVVGFYTGRDGTSHGYLWEKGKFTKIDYPGGVVSQPVDVNDHGKILGAFSDSAGRIHGYLWSKGRFTTIDYPDVAVTFPLEINNRDQIVGTAADDNMLTGARGFLLAKGVKGPFTTITFPGAPRTQVTSINDDGTIVGRYENPNAQPNPQRSGLQRAPDMTMTLPLH